MIIFLLDKVIEYLNKFSYTEFCVWQVFTARVLCGGEESSQNLFQGGRVVCGGHILPVSVRQKGELWNS